MHVVRRVYGLRTAFQEEGELIARGKEAEAKKMGLADPWQRREEMIVDLLESNIRAKRDRAIGSAKLLGSHRKLGLWETEFKAGIVILNAPTAGTMPPLTGEIPEEPE
jgi:hypothetical protein